MKIFLFLFLFTFNLFSYYTEGYEATSTDCRYLSSFESNPDLFNSSGHVWTLYKDNYCLDGKLWVKKKCENGYYSEDQYVSTCPNEITCESSPIPAGKSVLQVFSGDSDNGQRCFDEIDRLGGINSDNELQCYSDNCDPSPFPTVTLYAKSGWTPNCQKPENKISTPFTQEQCNENYAATIINDIAYLSDFEWLACDSTCYATKIDCPKDFVSKNNVCVNPKDDMSCPVPLDCNSWSLGVAPEKSCNLSCKCQDVPFETIEVSCSDSNSTTPDDSNTSNPDNDSTTGGGTTDSNTTNPDNNSTTGGGSSGGGSTDSNTTNPDNNSTNGGGSSGGGSSGGDTNQEDDTQEDDTNSTTYKESETQAKDRGEIDGKLDDIYKTLDKIKQDFDSLLNMVQNGFTISSISSGSNPKFCATIFQKQICLDLCDTFSQFQPIFYFIFTLVFLFASIRIYFQAFKMRT